MAETTETLSEIAELLAMGDPTIDKELGEQIDSAESEFIELKKELRFRGPYDDHDVILSIHAGPVGQMPRIGRNVTADVYPLGRKPWSSSANN